jgi:hypothetical protein
MTYLEYCDGKDVGAVVRVVEDDSGASGDFGLHPTARLMTRNRPKDNEVAIVRIVFCCGGAWGTGTMMNFFVSESILF